MKRYLFIDGQLNGGGAERVLLDILHHFDYGKCQVDLLQIVGGGSLADEIPSAVRVLTAWDGYTLDYRLRLHAALRLGWNAPFRNRLRRTLGEQAHYDVAVSFLEGLPLKAHAMLTDVADRNYTWVHCDLHTAPYEAAMFHGEQDELNAYNAMTKVICVAQDTRAALLRRFPSLQPPVEVVFNPIDVEKIERMASEATVSNDGLTIAVVGRWVEQKKLDRVIRLAHRLKADAIPVKIQLLGDGELRGELERQIRELDVADVVDLVGFVRNPFPYVAAADLLLSTSGWEGFSLVICEAMALGTPVVATRTAGPVEIIQDNRYGILCDHDDESIYRAVRQMLDDSSLREQYAQRGRERVQDFAVEHTMQQVEAL